MSLMNVAFSISTYSINLEVKKESKEKRDNSMEKFYRNEKSLKAVENAKRLAEAEFSVFRY